MTKLDTGHNNVQGCERLRPLEPAHPALAGQICRSRVLEHQTFISSKRCLLEKGLQLDSVLQHNERRKMKGIRPFDLLQFCCALAQRLIQQVVIFVRQQIENHESHGYLADPGWRRALPPETLLQQGKWEHLSVFIRDDLC